MSHRVLHPVPRPHRGRRPAAALAVAVGATGLLAAPVAAATDSGAATPAVTKVLTNASNGSTTAVTKGEQVVVKLTSDGFRWTEASVINASAELVLRKESGHVSRNGSSTTTFLVVGYGNADLEATGTNKCSAGPVCNPLSVTWSANVYSYVLDPPPAT